MGPLPKYVATTSISKPIIVIRRICLITSEFVKINPKTNAPSAAIVIVNPVFIALYIAEITGVFVLFLIILVVNNISQSIEYPIKSKSAAILPVDSFIPKRSRTAIVAIISIKAVRITVKEGISFLYIANTTIDIKINAKIFINLYLMF